MGLWGREEKGKGNVKGKGREGEGREGKGKRKVKGKVKGRKKEGKEKEGKRKGKEEEKSSLVCVFSVLLLFDGVHIKQRDLFFRVFATFQGLEMVLVGCLSRIACPLSMGNRGVVVCKKPKLSSKLSTALP